MPVSKRQKQVSLTKTKKKDRSNKEKLIEKIRECVDKYQNIIVFEYTNMRTNLFRDIQDKWESHSKFVMGKNKVMQIALGKDQEQEMRDNLHMISQVLEKEKGLLFTNKSDEYVKQQLSKLIETEYAQAGQIANQDVILEKGSDIFQQLSFQGTMEPYLRKLGLNTSLVNTEIYLNDNYVVAKQGIPLNPEQCKLLKLLKVKLGQFELIPICIWNKSGAFKKL